MLKWFKRFKKWFKSLLFLIWTRTDRKPRSKGEREVIAYLNKNGYKYRREYRIRCNLGFQRNVYIDFYLPKKKIFIEYNGRQHYEFVPKFHKTMEDFNNQLFRDMVVRKYCEYKKIKLIELPWYLTEDSIKTTLSKEVYG